MRSRHPLRYKYHIQSLDIPLDQTNSDTTDLNGSARQYVLFEITSTLKTIVTET